MKKTALLLIWFCTVALFGFIPLHAQVALTGSGYTQNFNGLPNLNTAGVYSWTDNSTLAGWYATTATSSGPATPYYRVTNANGTTPTTTGATPTSILAFRSGLAQTDGSLGTISNGTYTGSFGVQFVNNTGSTITSLTISFTGEQWAYNTGAANTLVFSYSQDATALSSGTWTTASSLNFTALYSGNSSNQALDGNGSTLFNGSTYVAKTDGQAGGPGALNYTTISATITGLSVAEGETVWLKWSDNFSGTGLGQALGIDNLSVSAVPEPSVASLLLTVMLGALIVRPRVWQRS